MVYNTFASEKKKEEKKNCFLPKTEILALIHLVLIIDLFVPKMELTKIKLHRMKSEKKKKI